MERIPDRELSQHTATDSGPLALPDGETDTSTDSAQIVSDLREERL